MSHVAATRGLHVSPLDMRKAVLLPAFGFIAAVAGVSVAARDRPGVLWLLPVLALIFAVIVRTLQRQRVLLDDGTLRVQAGLHTLRVRLADLDPSKARVVDLDEQPELRPFLKTFGTALPGYKTGHFRLRDHSRAFVLLTGSRHTLVLEERNGRRVLLSLEKPHALLDAFRST